MRRLLALSVAVQSVGAIASLLVVVCLAVVAGPSVQGDFATLKAAHDLGVAVVTLGVPSGFIYVINKSMYTRQTLKRQALRYVPIAMLLAGIGMYAALKATGVGQGALVASAVLMATASAAATYFLFERAILLTLSDGLVFAAFSSLPPVVLLCTVLSLHSVGPVGLPAAFAISWLLNALLMEGWLQSRLRSHEEELVTPEPDRFRTLVAQSGHSLAQGVLMASVVFAPIAAIHWLTRGSSTVGIFSIVSMTITTPNLLLAMVAPILYNRWSKADTNVNVGSLMRSAFRGAMALQACGLALIPAVPWLVRAVLGPEYAPAADRISILICALAPLAFSRVVAPLLQATGGTGMVTAAWACRLAACALLLPLAVNGALSPLNYGVGCLLLGEYAALIPILGGLHRLRRRP